MCVLTKSLPRETIILVTPLSGRGGSRGESNLDYTKSSAPSRLVCVCVCECVSLREHTQSRNKRSTSIISLLLCMNSGTSLIWKPNRQKNELEFPVHPHLGNCTYCGRAQKTDLLELTAHCAHHSSDCWVC